MEFDREARNFQLLAEVLLAAVPTKGDKVIVNLGEERIGHVFEVYEVHFADDAQTDVLVLRVSNTNDYLCSMFPDIV
jgi:hypothetical protein